MNPGTGFLDSVNGNLLGQDGGDTRNPPAREPSMLTSAFSRDGGTVVNTDMIAFDCSALKCVHCGSHCGRPHYGATTPGRCARRGE